MILPTQVNIWVQVRKLPFEFRCYKYAKSVAQLAGDLVHFEDLELENTELEGQFVRIRVQIDINKPLLSGFFLKRDELKPTWVSFK